MRTSEAAILFVADAGGEDDAHWISRWEGRLATASRVIAPQDDVASLAAAIGDALELARAAGKPVVLVGHGAGVHAIAQAVARFDVSHVRGAFLVNPSSAWNLPAPPRDPFPFPSLLVVSRDDPHATYEEMQDLGLDWGAHVVDAGAIGRIDGGSGHGPWPEGLMKFGAFLARL